MVIGVRVSDFPCQTPKLLISGSILERAHLFLVLLYSSILCCSCNCNLHTWQWLHVSRPRQVLSSMFYSIRSECTWGESDTVARAGKVKGTWILFFSHQLLKDLAWGFYSKGWQSLRKVMVSHNWLFSFIAHAICSCCRFASSTLVPWFLSTVSLFLLSNNSQQGSYKLQLIRLLSLLAEPHLLDTLAICFWEGFCLQFLSVCLSPSLISTLM